MKYDCVPEMHFSGYVNKEWHKNTVPHNSCNHDFFYKIQKYRQIMCKTVYNVVLWKHENERILVLDNVAMRVKAVKLYYNTKFRLTLSVEL